MKLAEALLLRADLQKKLESVRERIKANVVVQEGDTPLEEPNALLREALGVLGQLERLVAAINRVNLQHTLADGMTLTDAIARRDMLKQQHALFHAAIAGTQKDPFRYSNREIKWITVVNVPQLQQQAEEVARQLRELNARLQEANWHAEVNL